ncbi:hypothetical protein [Photobacterium sp. 1_MG-2023]|uniref:hypothetical protein n=1 Tax=Photobacterium sp. 1_MG-2023 TaxID=3062646 RepID=UPI0026E34566|nr:hypothetical protein [Photobacterium sp. 1_MG-2023]MDO6707391.1 hypothetical protein [Photobacterium sp. 1_MG-2023]
MIDIEKFKTNVIDKYQPLLINELTSYLDSQRDFFADYEIQVIDFEFNPDHACELIINFLVTGEDAWEEKVKKDSDYYTTDWKFYLYNVDVSPSEKLEEILSTLSFDLAPYHEGLPDDTCYEMLHRIYDQLFLMVSSIVKTESVLSVVQQYNLSEGFRVQLIDSRNDKDYGE